MTGRGRQYADEVRRGVEELTDWLRTVPRERLYLTPPDGEWTVMENVVHVIEFLPYWAGQIRAVVADPGKPFGRTHDDAERIAWIGEHRDDDVESALRDLPLAADEAAAALDGLPDGVWNATGIHARKGEMPLAEIVEFFVTDHLRDHIDQARRTLTASSG